MKNLQKRERKRAKILGWIEGGRELRKIHG